MVYWLESDTFADEDAFLKLAGGRWGTPLYDRLKASYCDLKAIASRGMSNGYLLEHKALQYCRGKRQILALLCTPVLDKPALVHKRGDECECIRGEWQEGYDYLIHAFLKKNPHRTEILRNQAQVADRRDKRLKALVYERDGGCCRYCRSGPLSPKTNKRTKDRRKILHFDHVDPDKPAGPNGEGFVVACARCNEEKSDNSTARTPEEAGMVLLRQPTATERAEWAERGQALFDAANWGPEHADIIGASSVTSSSDHATDHPSHDDASPDPAHDADDDPGDGGRGEVHPDSPGQASDHAPAQPAEGIGSGRVGKPHDSGPDRAATAPSRKPSQDQPVRTSADPDIYTGRSRASPPDLPPYRWPPGSVPVEPRRRHQDPDSSERLRPPWT